MTSTCVHGSADTTGSKCSACGPTEVGGTRANHLCSDLWYVYESMLGEKQPWQIGQGGDRDESGRKKKDSTEEMKNISYNNNNSKNNNNTSSIVIKVILNKNKFAREKKIIKENKEIYTYIYICIYISIHTHINKQRTESMNTITPNNAPRAKMPAEDYS